MRRITAAGLMLLTSFGVPAQDDLTQRQAHIAAERAALAARAEREATDCRQRFAVTPCLDEVRRRQRQAQAALDAEQRAIDEARRARRLADRQAAVERKQAEVARRLAASAATVGSAAAPAAAAASVPPVAPAPQRRAPSDAAAKAAARAEAARRLQAEIQADQARIRDRQARRAASGKPVHPLPAPPAGPASDPR